MEEHFVQIFGLYDSSVEEHVIKNVFLIMLSRYLGYVCSSVEEHCVKNVRKATKMIKPHFVDRRSDHFMLYHFVDYSEEGYLTSEKLFVFLYSCVFLCFLCSSLLLTASLLFLLFLLFCACLAFPCFSLLQFFSCCSCLASHCFSAFLAFPAFLCLCCFSLLFIASL